MDNPLEKFIAKWQPTETDTHGTLPKAGFREDLEELLDDLYARFPEDAIDEEFKSANWWKKEVIQTITVANEVDYFIPIKRLIE